MFRPFKLKHQPVLFVGKTLVKVCKLTPAYKNVAELAQLSRANRRAMKDPMLGLRMEVIDI